MAIIVQIIATVVLCLSCMNTGFLLSWPSSTILLFRSENTTLNRPMTDTEIGLFSSLPSIGSLLGNAVAAFLLDKLGRKNTVILTSFLYVIGWSIISLTNRVEIILMTVAISGAGSALFIQVTIFISEISQDSIRGTLTACPTQFYSLGFLISYLLGGSLGYYGMVYTYLIMAVLGVIMITVLKESPLTLMAKGRDEDAAKSIAFYRRAKTNSAEVLKAMNDFRRSLHPASEDTKSLTAALNKNATELETEQMTCWQFFKATPSTRRQFYIAILLITSVICQGLPILQVYAKPMFDAAVGDYISPNLCSVIMGAVVIVAGLIGAYLVDVIGRRPLQIYSSIAAGLCCLILGTQLITGYFPKWTIPLFVYAFAIFHTIGSGTVALVILSEIFLPKVKSILSILVVQWSCICLFISLFAFNLLVQWIGLSLVFYFFSFICFSTSAYCFYFLPESKGLPVYAIQELYMKNKA